MPTRTIAALTELANELTERVDVLEKDNQQLRKAASEQTTQAPAAASAPQVPEAVIEDTVNAMHKAGAIAASQVEASKQIMSSDPTAAYRVIQRLLDVQRQVKTAGACDRDSVSGGRLADCSGADDDPQAACLDRMMSILRIF